MKIIRFYLIILTTTLIFLQTPLAAPRSCKRYFSLSRAQLTWDYAREKASPQTPFFQTPYGQTLSNLSLLQKIRLQNVLKSYEPTIDFLFLKHSQKFIEQVSEILNKKNPQETRDILIHVAQKGLAAYLLTEETVLQKPSLVPTFRTQLRLLYARMTTPSFLSWLRIPPEMPYWIAKLPPKEVLLKFINHPEQIDVSLFTRPFFQTAPQREVYIRNVRTWGNTLLFGATALFISYNMIKSFERADAEADSAAAQLQHQKEQTYRQAVENLAQARKSLETAKADPQVFIKKSLIDMFRESNHREPSTQELQKIEKLAEQLAEKRQL